MIPGTRPERRVLIPPTLLSADIRGEGVAGGTLCVLEGLTMGTFWKVCCFLPPDGIPEGEARSLVEDTFHLVISQMSHWDQSSLLCGFNRAPAGTWVPLPPEFLRVLGHALQVAEESGGLCDPTLGAVVDLYGFGPSPVEPGPPAAMAVQEAARQRGWGRLKLDAGNQSAWQPGGLRLDLSAIAKGFAVDLAAENLGKAGVRSYLVEIGGEVRGAGCKPGGEPWWCGVEALPGGGGGAETLPETLVALCGLSVATSGDSLRERRVEGDLISHLIDPLSCRPAGRALAAVSVFHPSCMTADAWSTALFIAGPEKGPALAEARNLAALFTCRTPDGLRQIETAALKAMME